MGSSVPPFGWKEAFRRVCVCQPSTSAFGEVRNRERGAVDRIWVLSEAVWMWWCIVTCHPPFEMLDSAWLVEVKPDSEIARGKSKRPRGGSEGRGCPGQVSVPRGRRAKLGALGCQQPRQSLTCCSTACSLAEPGA